MPKEIAVREIIVSFGLFLLFLGEQWVLVTALIVTLWLLYFTEARKAGPALSPQQAITLTNAEGGVFLDIREAKDFKQGHIAGAINIPSASLPNRMGELNAYQEKPVVVVCRLGQTSSAAVKQLRAEGFNEAHRMAGGMLSWDDNRLPVTK